MPVLRLWASVPKGKEETLDLCVWKSQMNNNIGNIWTHSWFERQVRGMRAQQERCWNRPKADPYQVLLVEKKHLLNSWFGRRSLCSLLRQYKWSQMANLSGICWKEKKKDAYIEF